MGQPTGADIYATLIALLSEQEGLKITYKLAWKEDRKDVSKQEGV